MKKKVVSCLLAAAMVVSSGAAVPGFFFTPEKVQAEENDTKAEKENLALKGTAAASEAEADSTSAAKAIDGNKRYALGHITEQSDKRVDRSDT